MSRLRFFFAGLSVTALCGVLFFVLHAGPGVSSHTPSTDKTNSIQAALEKEPYLPPPRATAPTEPDTQGDISVGGVVVDELGKPLDGVRLLVMAGDPILAGLLRDMALSETFSDNEGCFLLSGLRSSVPYLFSVTKEGYYFAGVEQNGERLAQMPKTLPENGVAGAKVFMQRIGSISGVVVDKLGRPVPDVSVYASFRKEDFGDNPIIRVSEKRTGKNGEFAVPGISEREAGLWVERYFGHGRADLPVVYGGQTDPLLAVVLDKGEQKSGVRVRLPIDISRVVEGRVVDTDGNPVSGARVWVWDVGRLCRVGGLSGTTPATGAFRVEGILEQTSERAGVPPEEVKMVRVGADCEGYGLVQDDDNAVVAVGARNVEVVMRRIQFGAIECRMFDAASGGTIRDATVYLGTRAAFDSKGKLRGARPSLLGGWATLDRVPAGNTSLVVQAAGYGMLVKDNIVVEEGKTTRVEIPLKGAGLLCVKILAPEGDASSRPDGLDFGAMVGVYPLESAKDSQSLAVIGQMQSNERSPLFRSKLDCGETYLEPPSLHRDIELGPGAYMATMSYSETKIYRTEGGHGEETSGTTYEVEKLVEITSGSVTPLVWDVESALKDNGGRLIVDLGEYGNRKCVLIARKRPSSSSLSDESAHEKQTEPRDLVYRGTRSGESVVEMPVPSGEISVLLDVRHPSGNYALNMSFAVKVSVPDGGTVRLSYDQFRPRGMQ